MKLTYGEALEHAQNPGNAIALGLVLLSRIADALEEIAEKGAR